MLILLIYNIQRYFIAIILNIKIRIFNKIMGNLISSAKLEYSI